MGKASIMVAVTAALAFMASPAAARPHAYGFGQADDRYGYFGPVVQRKAKRYRAHAGRHHRRRAARIVRAKVKAVRPARVAAPLPLPRPTDFRSEGLIDSVSVKIASVHPMAWLAGEGPPLPSAAPERPLPAPAEPAGKPSILAEARRWLGKRAHQLGLPARLWCADFMNMVLRRAGFAGTGSRWAKSFARYGERLPGPKPGAIIVLHRGSPRSPSGHVGVVSGQCRDGRIRVVSGNHGRRVAEACYPRRRVVAYVAPKPRRVASN